MYKCLAFNMKPLLCLLNLYLTCCFQRLVRFHFLAFFLLKQNSVAFNLKALDSNLPSTVCFQLYSKLPLVYFALVEATFNRKTLCFHLEATVFNLASIICFQCLVSFLSFAFLFSVCVFAWTWQVPNASLSAWVRLTPPPNAHNTGFYWSHQISRLRQLSQCPGMCVCVSKSVTLPAPSSSSWVFYSQTSMCIHLRQSVSRRYNVTAIANK